MPDWRYILLGMILALAFVGAWTVTLAIQWQWERWQRRQAQLRQIHRWYQNGKNLAREEKRR